MLDFARQHLGEPVHLTDVATALRRHPAYLCSLFSHVTGTTFHHHLDSLRLEKAKAMLRDPVRPILEVAYAVGYTDANYFRQAFKAKTGCAPSTWRRQHASNSRGEAR